MKSLKNKVTIVTGGRSRLGRLLARSLATVGARVLVADFAGHDEPGEALPPRGPDVELMDVDVTSASDVERMVGECEKRFGRVDLLVHNTASHAASLRTCSFGELTVDDWHQSMNLNMLAPFLCCRAVLPAMKRAGGGQVIHVVSAAPRLALHLRAGNGALLAMTAGLANELHEYGIAVDTVAAGYARPDLAAAPTGSDAPIDALDAIAMLVRHRGAPSGRTVHIERLIADDEAVRAREAQLARRTARRVAGLMTN